MENSQQPLMNNNQNQKNPVGTAEKQGWVKPSVTEISRFSILVGPLSGKAESGDPSFNGAS